AQREADRLFAELSEPAVLSQLLRSLEEGAIQPDPAELGVFLGHLGPRALPILLHGVETTKTPGLQARLQQAVETLARDHQPEVVRLLGSDDTAVACGAARIAGKLTIADAVPGVVALLGRGDPAVRRTAVEALIHIRNGAALDALQDAIEDEDRDVRLLAVRGLAALRYLPARARLEKALEGRIVRDADLTEKMAFFEAFGAVATADNIDTLDRMLNGKKLFSRQSPELRACAAMALGKINAPAARTALEKAADDAQPIVRNAVLKALRRERGAGA
ncbi:MAG: HEAT repeat domain-containing protein, partial [Longimicrobiales bacterium]